MRIVGLFIGLLFVVSFSGFAQTPPITFERVKLSGIGSIEIPSIMELQSGLYQEFSNARSKELGYDVSGHIIFQQSGRNDVFTSSNTYARVMISEDRGTPGDYNKISTKISFSGSELRALDTAAKAAILKEFSQAGIGVKLIRWDGVSIDSVGGRSSMKVSYLRQLNENPSVYVETYYIHNYDRQYTLVISYRDKDADIWRDVLARTKSSFTVTNIR